MYVSIYIYIYIYTYIYIYIYILENIGRSAAEFSINIQNFNTFRPSDAIFNPKISLVGRNRSRKKCSKLQNHRFSSFPNSDSSLKGSSRG